MKHFVFSRFKALMIMISSSYLISKLCFETRSPSQVVFNTFISFFKLSQTYIFPSYNRLNVNLSYKLPQVETFLNIQFPKLQPLKCKFKLQPSNGTISQVKTFPNTHFPSCNRPNIYFQKLQPHKCIFSQISKCLMAFWTSLRLPLHLYINLACLSVCLLFVSNKR